MPTQTTLATVTQRNFVRESAYQAHLHKQMRPERKRHLAAGGELHLGSDSVSDLH